MTFDVNLAFIRYHNKNVHNNLMDLISVADLMVVDVDVVDVVDSLAEEVDVII